MSPLALSALPWNYSSGYRWGEATPNPFDPNALECSFQFSSFLSREGEVHRTHGRVVGQLVYDDENILTEPPSRTSSCKIRDTLANMR